MRGIKRVSRHRAISVVSAISLVLTVAVACTGEEAPPGGASAAPGQGGTVRILSQNQEFVSLDPQRIYVATEANVSRLITRTLTTFDSEPGAEGGELVGDLAVDTGRATENNTVWEFDLREGIKWETGELVTCEDIRYGVLRNFDIRNGKDAIIDGGPPYPVAWLDVDEDYTGPYTDADADPQAVSCQGDSTIRFELKSPVSNFAYAVSMTAFAPVPAESDTRAEYGTAPMSTGPYKLTSYEPAKDGEGLAVFERNKHWDPESDAVRGAKPDRIEWVFGVDLPAAAQKIVAGDPEYSNAVMYENIPNAYVQQVVNDSTLMQQTVSGTGNFVRYVAINTESVPDLDCRKALVYAFNKRKYLDAFGGDIFGDYAVSMIPPNDPGHKEFDVFGTGGNPDGDLDKATELLEQAKDCPDSLTLDAYDTAAGSKAAETIVDTYGRLGIKVSLNLLEASTYFKEMNFLDKQHDLTMVGWVADWPGGSGTIPALFHGDSIIDGGNNNHSRLNDPDINQAIDAAADESDPQAANKMWGELDELIAAQAAVIPVAYGKSLSLCGADVRGAFLNAQWASVDIVSLGVKGK